MRIPNYLRLAPSGIWHFRQRLSVAQARKTGRREITRSLGTHDLLTAQRRALDLAQAYAQATTVRGLSVFVARDGVLSADEIARAIALGYKVIRHPDGTVEVEASGKADHDFAMDALERIGPLDQEPCYQELMRAAKKAESQRVLPAPDPASKIPVIQIEKAVTQWLAEIKSSTRPKTFKIKTTAVEGFAKHYGERSSLKDAQRIGYHAHLYFPTRKLACFEEVGKGTVASGGTDGAGEATGFGSKLTILSNKRTSAEFVEMLNAKWAELSNELAGANGLQADYDHRSYARQGVDLAPQPTVGQAATALERKGMETRRGNQLREAVKAAQQVLEAIPATQAIGMVRPSKSNEPSPASA